MPNPVKIPPWTTPHSGLEPIADGINEIITAVNALSPGAGAGMVGQSVAGAGTVWHVPRAALARGLVVRITGSSGAGQYTGRILVGDPQLTAGTASAPPFGMTDPGVDDCIFLNLAESNGTATATTNLLSVGQWVTGDFRGYVMSGSTRLAVVTGGRSGQGPILCTVASDGGSGGSSSSNCSWTYTCTSFGGASLGTTQTPSLNVRLPNVTYSAATGIALACMNNASPPVFQLLLVAETPTETVCT